MALTDKLSAIGNAIRNKAGTTELLSLDQMPDAITNLPSGGDIEVEPIVLTGDCSNSCSGAMASNYIRLFSNTISTKDITNTANMFLGYSNEIIPFDINFKNTNTTCNINSMFKNASNLKSPPTLKGNISLYSISSLFNGCANLKEIPDNYFDEFNFTSMNSATSGYAYDASAMFEGCYSLRRLPVNFLNNMNPKAINTYTYFWRGWAYNYSLDELVNLPIPYEATYTSNAFTITFASCSRLKELIFAKQDNGEPIEVNWKSQTIDLSISTGYGGTQSIFTDYNSGITADKEVKDDATYQALKNDADWFSISIPYSRYNRTSAVNTINSLPDTSAYLATAGGTNTIKFKGEAGSATDGGAINTMTEEEIAVATAKGWTVSFV